MCARPEHLWYAGETATVHIGDMSSRFTSMSKVVGPRNSGMRAAGPRSSGVRAAGPRSSGVA